MLHNKFKSMSEKKNSSLLLTAQTSNRESNLIPQIYGES